MGNGPSLKNFGLCRPLIENKRKSITKEEIEVFCFHMFNVNEVQNTQYVHIHTHTHAHTHTHTHPFNSPFSRTTWVGRYQKGKTNLDFTEARDSEWQWHQLDHMQVCTSLQTDNHASTPPLCFLQAGCPSCRPTNSVKALKALKTHNM